MIPHPTDTAIGDDGPARRSPIVRRGGSWIPDRTDPRFDEPMVKGAGRSRSSDGDSRAWGPRPTTGSDQCPSPKPVSGLDGCWTVRSEVGDSLALVYTCKSGEGGVSGLEMHFSYPSPKWVLQRESKRLLPDFRGLQKCYLTRHLPLVEVHRSGSRETAAYRGLCTCQNRWACPVCSAKISAHRAEEVTQGIATHRAKGGTSQLLTFTCSHTREDSLSGLQKRLRDAKRRWSRSAPVKRVLASTGLLGTVTALEVTFGHESGWHPHFHSLAFTARDLTDHEKCVLAFAWLDCCNRVGLTCSVERGLDVRGGTAAGEYVAKLGLEVALAVAKKGRARGRFGMWELLAESRSGEAWAGSRFVEFVRTMKGRHQLHWSDGLRAALSLDDEKTDAEIMAEKGGKDEALFAQLTAELWRAVYRHELRGELLQLLGVNRTEQARSLLREFEIDDSGLIIESDAVPCTTETGETPNEK